MYYGNNDFRDYLKKSSEEDHLAHYGNNDFRDYLKKSSEEDYLAHYGVKGMKWGRRKKRTVGTYISPPFQSKERTLFTNTPMADNIAKDVERRKESSKIDLSVLNSEDIKEKTKEKDKLEKELNAILSRRNVYDTMTEEEADIINQYQNKIKKLKSEIELYEKTKPKYGKQFLKIHH